MEYANLVAREMIYKCGFSRRLGPVALMDSTTGFLRGQSANYVSDMGSELTAVALTDVSEVRTPAVGSSASFRRTKKLSNAVLS